MRLISFVSLIFSIFLVESAKANEVELSFSTALKLAMANATEIERQKNSVAIATSNQAIQNVQSDPTLIWSSSLGSKIAEQAPSSGSGSRAASGSASPRIELGDGLGPDFAMTFDQSHSLTASQTIYDWGRKAAQDRQSELAVEIAKIGLSESEQILTFRVARAYLRSVTSWQIFSTTESQLQNAEIKLKENERNYRVGGRSEADFLRAQIDRDKAALAEKRARDEFDLAFDELISLMRNGAHEPGHPQGNGVGNSDGAAALPTQKFRLPVMSQKNGDAWLEVIDLWSKNPPPSIAESKRGLSRQSLHEETKRIEANQMPLLSAQVGLGITGSLEPLRPGLSGGLQFFYNIPWNGLANSEKERVSLQIKDLQLADQLEATQRSTQIHSAILKITKTSSQIESLLLQQKALERYRDLVKRRYGAGKASALEVSSAEDELISSKIEMVRIQGSIAATALDVAQILGVTDFEKIF